MPRQPVRHPRVWVVALPIAFCLAVLVIAGRTQIIAFAREGANPGAILAVVAAAAVFPISAMAYQIFQRETQLIELQRDFELLGIIRRSPDAGISEDLSRRYSQIYNPWNFAIHTMLVVLLTVFGMSLFFWPPDATLLDAKAQHAMRYGFLGAYTFAVQLLYRRYTTLDLQPTVYLNCAITLIVGLVFNYAAFEALGKLAGGGADAIPSTGAAAGIEAVVAFSLGYFPYLAITWFNQLAHNALNRRQRRSDSLPLGMVDGISEFHETRLRDEGIDNIQNLSSARIDELLLNTRFTAQQVIEWVDQAILYVYLEPNEIESFRRGGVRTISDFQAFWGSCSLDLISDGKVVVSKDDVRQARQAHAQQLQSTCEHLDILYRTTLEGPNMAYVSNYWKNSKDLAQEVHRYALERQKELTRAMFQAAQVVYRTAGDGSHPSSETIVSLISATASAFEEHSGDADLLMTRAMMADHAGEYDKAMGLYREVIKQAPNRTDCKNALAWLFASKWRRPEYLDEAVRLAQEAIALARRQGHSSDVPSLLDTLATAEIRLAENAKDATERARHLDVAEQYLHEADRAPASQRWPTNPAAVAGHLQEIKVLRERFKDRPATPPAAPISSINETKTPDDRR